MTIVYTVINDKKHYVTRYEQVANGEYALTISQTEAAAKNFGSVQAAADVIRYARNPYERKFVISEVQKEKKVRQEPERGDKIS
jgi:hypothetical protein